MNSKNTNEICIASVRPITIHVSGTMNKKKLKEHK